MAGEAITNVFTQNPIAESNPPIIKKKRNLPGTPDPEVEFVALSSKILMATNRFLCEICRRGFQRDQSLQLHRRVHNLPWKLRQRSREVDPPKFMEEINTVTQITPKNPFGYIVAARIAECDGKKKEAKELIKRGYEECPSNEDVWVEALRFASIVEAKKLIDMALKAIPNSVSFHKAVLEQADEKDSRNMLQKAMNSCYESAIRSAIGFLKEADRKIDKVGEILDWGIRFMHLKRGVENDKNVSKEEAEFVEQSSFVTICKNAIHKTIANWEKNLMKRVLRMDDRRLKQESGKDLKRKLHEIFDEDWNSIQEGEDFSSLNRNRAEELASTLDAIPISGFRAIDPEVYLAGLRFEDELRSFDLDSRRNM